MPSHVHCISSFLLLVIVILASCEKNTTNISYQVAPLFSPEEEAILSKHLSTDKFTFILNSTSADQFKVFLGRTLFYDKNLSTDKSVSCASCHQQHLAFADDKALSDGPLGRKTARNSLSLGAFTSFVEHYDEPVEEVVTSFFWDERVTTIEEQLRQTITNPDEMGMELHQLSEQVKESAYANILYQKAFEGQAVQADNIIEAIAAFVNTIASPVSPFDDGLEDGLLTSSHHLRDPFPSFSLEQNRGKALFVDNCASCHGFSLSRLVKDAFDISDSAVSNGLDLIYADKGMGIHTDESNNGKFKVPGLRNIALTAPYMHDGRFATLEEVLEFYSSSIQNHPNLDIRLKDQDGLPKRLGFTEQDKQDLVAFLETLTGYDIQTAEAFSNPFK